MRARSSALRSRSTASLCRLITTASPENTQRNTTVGMAMLAAAAPAAQSTTGIAHEATLRSAVVLGRARLPARRTGTTNHAQLQKGCGISDGRPVRTLVTGVSQ